MRENIPKPNHSKASQEYIIKRIIELCAEKFLSLGEIAEVLKKSKHTVRAGYLYPMVKSGLLIQKHPAGTKSAQRYMTNVDAKDNQTSDRTEQ